MNRRLFVHTSMLASACVALPTLARAADGKVGKLDPAELMRVTKEAGDKVAALQAGPEPLSAGDQSLLTEIATGGMMQLAVSKAALAAASSADVKAYAEAEIDEQTGLSKKLAEYAGMKKATLPDKPDEATTRELEALKKLTGTAVDKRYLKDIGIAGHKLLEATMKKVQAKAADPFLKSLAQTTLPLIKVHLEVAQDESKDVG